MALAGRIGNGAGLAGLPDRFGASEANACSTSCCTRGALSGFRLWRADTTGMVLHFIFARDRMHPARTVAAGSWQAAVTRAWTTGSFDFQSSLLSLIAANSRSDGRKESRSCWISWAVAGSLLAVN